MPRCAWGSITRRRRVKGAPLLPGFYVRFTTADGRRTTVYGGKSLDEAEETRLRLQAEVQGLPYPERDTSPAPGPVVTENRGSPRPEAVPSVQPGVTDTTTPTGPTLREFLDNGYLAALQPPYGRLYYTPRFVVESIVRRVIGPKIKGLTPKEILKVKILDPACGSGSFLVAAYQFLLSHCIRYLTEHPEAAAAGGAKAKGRKSRDIGFQAEGECYATHAVHTTIKVKLEQAKELTVKEFTLRTLVSLQDYRH